ncbi:MAG: MBL fold metallo-hydrolase [Anaerolineaceae bacterium]|nr:MBL fold metallo-hydrolase [Anaerolineaceae bacterium]
MTKIICVVDNCAKEGTHLKAEHGLAFWIATDGGTMLFDVGQTAEVLSDNMAELHLDIKELSALAISHGHYDHTGGLEAILPKNTNLTVYANEDIFVPKFSLKEGKFSAIGFEFDRADYEKRAQWRLSCNPQEIFAGLWTTGEIIGRDEPEGRSASHYIFENDAYMPDPYCDDMSLVLKTRKGLVLICGCCHAGILNTLTHVKRHFDGPLIGVVGGIHLMNADGNLLNHVAGELEKDHSQPSYYLNHCTGNTALEALGARFGVRMHHFSAGETVIF